jgi:hypothetical protein
MAYLAHFVNRFLITIWPKCMPDLLYILCNLAYIFPDLYNVFIDNNTLFLEFQGFFICVRKGENWPLFYILSITIAYGSVDDIVFKDSRNSWEP